jgi:hypothetical protein
MKSWAFTAFFAVVIAGGAGCNAGMDVGIEGSGGAAASMMGGAGGMFPAGTGGAGGEARGTGGKAAETGGAAGVASGGAGTGGAGTGGTGTGTGGATGGVPGGDPAGAQACAALSKAMCGKAEACTPFATGLFFGSRATCEQRLALECLPRLAAPGTSATPAKISSCADSLATHPCAAFARGDLGSACAPQAGTLSAGAACGDDWQCSSTFCARAPDAVCGVCAPTTQVGGACVRGACSAGTVCPMGKSTCVALEPGQVGAACTVQEQCDVGNGVGCSPVTGRCIRLVLASAGTCGVDLAGSTYSACGASGTCSGLLAGTCSMAAPDGAACSTGTAGRSCLPPARCAAGRCTLPDPRSCVP